MARLGCLVSFIAAGCLTMSAQVKTVKDVEHALAAAKPDYAAALKTIKPALEHDETKNDPAAWYNAGKSAIGVWDKMLLNVQLGQAVNNDQKKEAAHDLIDAFNYLKTALPLDSVPNSKGKVKPKYSNDIYKLLSKNYRAYRNAGIFLYDLRDYSGAYDAWEIYLSMPHWLASRKKHVKADRDDELGQIYYYQAKCALNTGKNANAIQKLDLALNTGYSSKELYLYGMEAARREGRDSTMLNYAQLGYKLYGNKDNSFALYLINDRLKSEDYVACRVLVNEVLKTDADDNIKSQLYDVLGVADDYDKNFEGALANFQKAVVYDDNNAKAYFDLARVIYNEALKLAESGDPEGDARAKPGLEKAAEYFEKAYSLDGNLTQIPATLYGIYYRLGIGFEAKADYWQKRQ